MPLKKTKNIMNKILTLSTFNNENSTFEYTSQTSVGFTMSRDSATTLLTFDCFSFKYQIGEQTVAIFWSTKIKSRKNRQHLYFLKLFSSDYLCKFAQARQPLTHGASFVGYSSHEKYFTCLRLKI